ncbi:DUF3299 domain-containing protein [Ruegeria sp. THAF57]|uniref:HoxN/HupN/NixA family nickel/cobalt transporter n=1 Tax=Ruegeria sp. THAF57 TaxID=2744555 RepID=UPI0015DDA9F3|nr:DUF3299 domain-containing protein [Ruegeria sp. THAF57]
MAIVLVTATKSLSLPLVTWEDLVPSTEPYDDPFAAMPAAQLEDLRLILQSEMLSKRGEADTARTEALTSARSRIEAAGLDIEALFAQRELIMARRMEAVTGVSATHLEQQVMIDGYILPLTMDGRNVTSFLLVPWVGACIHTPAPPANQIIYASMPEGLEDVSLFQPMRISGQLKHHPAEHDLFLVDGRRDVPASYALESVTVVGTAGEMSFAPTVTPDLPLFVRIQAHVANVFTGAMTDMKAGASTKSALFALLIAFLYGAVHTLGPGHGKAVVISYFVGSGGNLRRGIMMGTQIAITHVLSAIVVVFLLDFTVRQATGNAPSDYRLIRLASYAAISVIGAVMLWRAGAALLEYRRHDHHHHSGGCASCAAAAKKAETGSGWLAAAIGVVPCTGALMVMLYGLANDLIGPAIVMVTAISFGMALSMAAIGVAAIWSHNWAAARSASSATQQMRFAVGARVAGAAVVFLIGATMFFLTLSQPAAVLGESPYDTAEIQSQTNHISSPEGQ